MQQLAIEPRNDTAAFGSPVAKDKTANEFEHDDEVFRTVLCVQE